MKPIIIKRIALIDGFERKTVSVLGIRVYMSERPVIPDDVRRQIGFSLISSDIPG